MNDSIRDKIRKQIGIEGKISVGLVGPFFGQNARSVEYVDQHLHLFDPKIVFIFVGDLEQRNLKANHRMIFTGRVESLEAVLGAFDCLLIPRFADIGSPMRKMVYGMAASLPVVTNSAEGMLITNGVHAQIDSLEHLPNALNDLANDPRKRQEMGAEARLYVRKNHSKDIMINRLIEFMENL
jgi:glycosyltransferase involved in cell wall biosynthesis